MSKCLCHGRETYDFIMPSGKKVKLPCPKCAKDKARKEAKEAEETKQKETENEGR